MIKTRTQLNALIRNKAAGDGDKAQIRQGPFINAEKSKKIP